VVVGLLRPERFLPGDRGRLASVPAPHPRLHLQPHRRGGGPRDGRADGDYEIPCRAGGDSSRTVPLTLPGRFGVQRRLLRPGPEADRLRAGPEVPGGHPLHAGVPEAVSSFGDLAKGEPLRVTVFEQNLFPAGLPEAGACPSAPRIARAWSGGLPWRTGRGPGAGGAAAKSPWSLPRHLLFNGVARLRDGAHVITVAALTSRHEPAAPERFAATSPPPGSNGPPPGPFPLSPSSPGPVIRAHSTWLRMPRRTLTSRSSRRCGRKRRRSVERILPGMALRGDPMRSRT